ncbi:MAG: PIN domain-containing protein [Cellulomonadaceae bacterium]|jgi:predicted nucleic acid-binding protein|nr:PIN domain-containing protein [Cellulomonadaceae bacterium]
MGEPECLDTNVLLRYVLGDIPHQQVRAATLLKSGRRFRVLDPVWVEMVYALEKHYALGRAEVCDILVTLAGLSVIVGDAEVMANVCGSYRDHPKLSFVDCLLAERAQQIGVSPLWTFDEKLAKQHPSATLVP